MSQFAICTLASVPLRKHPDLLSEMTSQLLFGDHYEVLDEHQTFQKIRGAHDGYEGWITARQGEAVSSEVFHALSDDPPEVLLDLTAAATLGDQKLTLVRGSHLPAEINGRRVSCSGTTLHLPQQSFSIERLEALASDYLHAPYHWGGRSPFGIDCSGFTQMVFKFFNVALPRDSQQQVKAGRPVFTLGDARPGDLAFFFEETSHVGLIISEGILHASSSVRHDDLDENGIRDRESGDYSHDLTCIRRFFEP
jgi:cell wall-associated NlpC family hydrolase